MYVHLWLWVINWLCVIIYDSAWSSMTLHDHLWLYMIIYDYVWSSMTMYDHLWLCMIIYDYVWSSLTMCDHLWLCTIISEYVWSFTTMYDKLWLCMIWSFTDCFKKFITTYLILQIFCWLAPVIHFHILWFMLYFLLHSQGHQTCNNLITANNSSHCNPAQSVILLIVREFCCDYDSYIVHGQVAWKQGWGVGGGEMISKFHGITFILVASWLYDHLKWLIETWFTK